MPYANFFLIFITIQVENLTVSFSDGRVLCLLLHHYYPDLMPLHLINLETTQNMPSQVCFSFLVDYFSNFFRGMLLRYMNLPVLKLTL